MHLSTRKIVYSIFVLVLLGFGVFFYKVWGGDVRGIPDYSTVTWSGCLDEYGGSIDCKECKKNGKMIAHSFGSTCEIPAKDGGDVCVYDLQCAKGCVYKENDFFQLGVCNTFSTTEGTHCRREWYGKIKCYFDIS